MEEERIETKGGGQMNGDSEGRKLERERDITREREREVD